MLSQRSCHVDHRATRRGSVHVEAIVAAGLESFAFEHVPSEPWPTLGQMIASGNWLFSPRSQGRARPVWYHHQWDLAFDNEYAVQRADELACNVKRGDPSSDLFGLNYFVTKLGGDEFLAIETNRAESIRTHALECAGRFEVDAQLRGRRLSRHWFRRGGDRRAQSALVDDRGWIEAGLAVSVEACHLLLPATTSWTAAASVDCCSITARSGEKPALTSYASRKTAAPMAAPAPR